MWQEGEKKKETRSRKLMYGQGDVLSLDPEECAIGSSVHGICRGHCDFCQNFQP